MKAIVLALLFVIVHSKREFYFGKRLGGNLISPLEEYSKSKTFQELFIEQKLDNFDPTDNRTWQQRYFVEDQHFCNETRDIAYLFIGGEGPISESWMFGGTWQSTAEETGALLFQLEHRFYGMSQPFDSLATENLKYLSSEQALADLANFIQFMNKKYNLSPDVKWIAFGGSYAGSLAAWLRLKYPHLVYAAVSSSAPLQAQLDFKEYLQIVAEDLEESSKNCSKATQQAFQEIEQAFDAQNQTALDIMDHLLKTCSPLNEILNSTKDIANFFDYLAGIFASEAQYDFMSGSVAELCSYMTDSRRTPLENFSEYLKYHHGGCIEYRYPDLVKLLQDNNLYSSIGIGGVRQWTYQTCSEFGFFQTSSTKMDVFGTKLPVQYFIDLCTDIFGDEFDRMFLEEAIEKTNDNYGGVDMAMDRIIFVHGSLDPWHALGKLEETMDSSPVVLIPGRSHCADMYPVSLLDPPEVIQAKLQIMDQVLDWCLSV